MVKAVQPEEVENPELTNVFSASSAESPNTQGKGNPTNYDKMKVNPGNEVEFKIDFEGDSPPLESVSENAYRVTMAIAGFCEEDLDIIQKENSLIVKGKVKNANKEVSYLHRGIANRAFERRFELADYVEVVGANLANGMLIIDLERELPEALKPRTIEIKNGSGAGFVGKAKKLLGNEEQVAA